MPENENPTIKDLLDKHGEVRFKTDKHKVSYIKDDGRYYYSVNGILVGISKKQLDDLIDGLPSNIGVIGWGEIIG